MPGAGLIDSAGSAQAQSDAILGHTLHATGGYLYAQLGSYALPSGNYALENGTYMAAAGGTTTGRLGCTGPSYGGAARLSMNDLDFGCSITVGLCCSELCFPVVATWTVAVVSLASESDLARFPDNL